MAHRQQPRRSARILALLSLSQIRSKSEKKELDIHDLILAATRTLTAEVEQTLENASEELNRSYEHLLKSETRAANIATARAMLEDAISMTQKAINRLGDVLEIPEFVQLCNQQEVREYAVEIINCVQAHKREINQLIDEVMEGWSLNRLTQIDADILRVATAEMAYLHLEHQVAIDEAVEIAKQYSGEDGYRFINGVLRRISDRLKTAVGVLS
ncbi:MAG: transcription antitermination factor NusB [Geminocystis sp.]|nr:transcription antitermination factor NusB [Geminocystis sp.]HIK38472.1 transcription antitermination protein NusB [Geminocystis sp. M7585_C2015_104]MCS7146849.1 transcription antitermination factor NusB [Geminocystis sp.]MCX8078869.1 transcription antitermination factor NusB [Geminocystis sp.]MDW8115674.1 transcription antitermination factor NusB [Geminocystis sp.]